METEKKISKSANFLQGTTNKQSEEGRQTLGYIV